VPGDQSPGIFRSACHYALGIEYRGTQYCGWQRQDGHTEVSVQWVLEKALSQVADQPITVTCAGRTDSGVHGCEQVVNFSTTAERPLKAWTLGVNSNLPRDVRVLWVQEVPEDFSARFSATARTYRYVILNRPVASALVNDMVTWEKAPLDEVAMHEAGQYLLGENDFSSFRGASCQSNTPFRFVNYINVSRHGSFVTVEIKANAFLHHMVRNIVGVLMCIGKGEKPVGWAKDVLLARDRRQAAKTAPSNGLYLLQVEYPESLGLPQVRGDNTDLSGSDLPKFEGLLGGFF